MPSKQIAYTLIIFIASITTAEAQLSYNPWTNPNDQETIAKYYERAAKVQAGNAEYYEPEAYTEIDKTSAYIELPSPESEAQDDGLLSKVGQIFKPKKEPKLIPNTEENRQAVYEIKNQKSKNNQGLLDSGSEMLDSLGLDKMKKSIKRKIPTFNTNNMIHKFEKASGVNFKSLAKKMRK